MTRRYIIESAGRYESLLTARGEAAGDTTYSSPQMALEALRAVGPSSSVVGDTDDGGSMSVWASAGSRDMDDDGSGAYATIRALQPEDPAAERAILDSPSLLDLLDNIQAAGGLSDEIAADLPLFGGTDPRDTGEDGDNEAIWSWDETHMLVGLGYASLKIVPRWVRYGEDYEDPRYAELDTRNEALEDPG